MKKSKDLLKKLLPVLLVIGVVVILIFLVTWQPQTEQQQYKTAEVMKRTIEKTLEIDGLVVTRSIDDEDKKVVQVFVNENDIHDIAPEEAVTLHIPALDEDVDGSVYSVSEEPRITGDTTEYEVISTCDTIPEKLLNGMHVEWTIVLGTTDDEVLAVPNSSLYKQDDQYYVDRVHEKRKVFLSRLGVDKTIQELEPVQVTIGFEGDEYTEVTDELKEGEKIAVQ
ncbi:MAG TPA: hypothetical protein VJB65_03510 [Patescibacteria group bacterium]|nr:hypothetical protein [Patescibacteria group bacterium]